MRKYLKTIKGSLFLILLVLLTMPFFQAIFNIIKLNPLKGAITEPEKANFNVRDWFSGAYQEQQEKYLNEAFGFRSSCIRINNQIAFTLFNKAKANGVLIGKDNYLYEENYIKAYYGTDYVGYDSIYKRMQQLKHINDELAKQNKNLVLIFAAGKGSFYPEYFPERYKREKGNTNYDDYTALTHQLQIPCIDFNKYFIENKNKSPYPLYPQYGIHWSYYGMALAEDSIIRFIEKMRNIDMPNLYWESIDIDQPKSGDYDIAEGMNIFNTLKSFDMGYPAIRIQSDSGKTKPSVLVVSDSFYWGMFNAGISSVFTNTQFWFYNHEIYPDSYQSPLKASEVNIKDEIAKYDVVIIMATDANLSRFGWGFIENMYAALGGANNR
jgi:hypothetical protein